MASRPRTLKLPPALDEIADLLAKQFGYSSRNAFIKGLIQYAAVAQGEHSITLPWSKLPLEDQDRVNEHLLTLAKRGMGERGMLLTHIMERVAKGMKPEDALAKEVGGK